MGKDHETGGLLAVFRDARGQIARYLAAHGAGDAVEDLMQELAIRLSQQPTKPIAAPLNYIYRAATHLMIDHRRSMTQAKQRDGDWADSFDQSSLTTDPSPAADRIVEGRAKLAMLDQHLSSLPTRARSILLLHRVDGVAQRDIATRLGVSLSTVESDLRQAYAHVAALRGAWKKVESE